VDGHINFKIGGLLSSCGSNKPEVQNGGLSAFKMPKNNGKRPLIAEILHSV